MKSKTKKRSRTRKRVSQKEKLCKKLFKVFERLDNLLYEAREIAEKIGYEIGDELLDDYGYLRTYLDKMSNYYDKALNELYDHICEEYR